MPQINPELRSSEPRLEIEMLDPSKVTLSRACDQCIKLMRKCNRDLPSCQRCAKRRSLCKYKNQPFYGSLSSSGSSKQINTSTHGSVVRARSFRNSMVGEKSNYYLPPCVLSNMSELNGVKINILSLDQQTFGSIFVYLRCVILPYSKLDYWIGLWRNNHSVFSTKLFGDIQDEKIEKRQKGKKTLS